MPVGAAPENFFFLIVSHIELQYDYLQLYCLGFITFVAVQSSGYKQRRALSASYCRLSIGKHKHSWRLHIVTIPRKRIPPERSGLEFRLLWYPIAFS